VIRGSPPLQIGQQLWGLLSRRPAAARERGYPMADGQIHPLNQSRVQPPREAQSLEGDAEICLCAEPHQVRDVHQLAPPLAFFHLAGDQARRHLPLVHGVPWATHLEPLTEVSREGREGEVEPVTGKERQTERRPGSLGECG
jgi:hypothetical protein